MMTADQLTRLAEAIQSLGYDPETADHWAVLIGDTPIIDDAGRVIVMEGEHELARLELKGFFTPQS